MQSRGVSVVVLAGVVLFGCGRGTNPTGPSKAAEGIAASTGGTASIQSQAGGLDALMHLQPALEARWNAMTEAQRQAYREQYDALPESTRDMLWQSLLAGSSSGAGGVTDLNEPPDAIFRTTPRANSEGVIRGHSPLDVTFNMCPSTDPDEGDVLKYLYDFDGSGAFERGACRATHTYETPFGSPRDFQATVCLSDRQPEEGHKICKTFTVSVSGGEKCRTITKGSATLAPNGPFTIFYNNQFQLGQGQAVLLTLNADDTLLLSLNEFVCGGGYVGLIQKLGATTFTFGQIGVAAPDPQACQGIIFAFPGASGGSLSWNMEVCDPGAF